MLLLTELSYARSLREHWLQQICSNDAQPPSHESFKNVLAALRANLDSGQLAAEEHMVLLKAASFVQETQPVAKLWTESNPLLIHAEAYLATLELGYRCMRTIARVQIHSSVLRVARKDYEARVTRACLCLSFDAETCHNATKDNRNFNQLELQALARVYDTSYSERCLTRLTHATILLISWFRVQTTQLEQSMDFTVLMNVAATLEGYVLLPRAFSHPPLPLTHANLAPPSTRVPFVSRYGGNCDVLLFWSSGTLTMIYTIPSAQLASKRLMALLTQTVNELDDDVLSRLMHTKWLGSYDEVATEDESPALSVWDLVSCTNCFDIEAVRVLAEAQLSLIDTTLSLRCSTFVLDETALGGTKRIKCSLPTRQGVKRLRRTVASPRQVTRPNLDVQRALHADALQGTQATALRLLAWRPWVGPCANAPPPRRMLLLAAMGEPLNDTRWLHLFDHQIGGGMHPLVAQSLHRLVASWPIGQKQPLEAVCAAYNELMRAQISKAQEMLIPGAPGLKQRLGSLMESRFAFTQMADSAAYERLITLYKAR